MPPQRDQKKAFQIALLITLACVSTPIILGLVGFYERESLILSLAIVFADLATVGVVWLLYALGKLGPKK